ncbi:MAG: hypothetical protein R3B09_34950 [Nannocystaceae bacterium]
MDDRVLPAIEAGEELGEVDVDRGVEAGEGDRLLEELDRPRRALRRLGDPGDRPELGALEGAGAVVDLEALLEGVAEDRRTVAAVAAEGHPEAAEGDLRGRGDGQRPAVELPRQAPLIADRRVLEGEATGAAEDVGLGAGVVELVGEALEGADRRLDVAERLVDLDDREARGEVVGGPLDRLDQELAGGLRAGAAELEVGGAGEERGPLDRHLAGDGGGLEGVDPLGEGVAGPGPLAAIAAAAGEDVLGLDREDRRVVGVGRLALAGPLGGEAGLAAEGDHRGAGARARVGGGGGEGPGDDLRAAADPGGAGEAELARNIVRRGRGGGLEVGQGGLGVPCLFGQAEREGAALVGAPLAGEAVEGGLAEELGLAVLLAEIDEEGAGDPELGPEGEGAAEGDHRRRRLAELAAAEEGDAVEQERPGPRAPGGGDVLIEHVAEAHPLPQGGREALAAVERRQVARPGLEEAADLGEGAVGIVEAAGQEAGDLEVEGDPTLAVARVIEAPSEEVEERVVVVILAEEAVEEADARLVILDRGQRRVEVVVGLLAVAELEGQLGGPVEEAGAAGLREGELDLLLGDLEELARPLRPGEEAGEELDRHQVLRHLLEEADEVLDRGVRIGVAGGELGEEREEEEAAARLLGAEELGVVVVAEGVEAAELVEDPLEAIEGRAEGRVDRQRLLVGLAGAVDLLEVLLQHLAGPDQRLGPLLAREPPRLGARRLGPEELVELRPRLVRGEVAARVLEGGDVQGIEAQGLAHRAEPLVHPIEAEHRQLAEAVVELGAGGEVGVADRRELADARPRRHVVAGAGHAQVLEVAPEAEVRRLGGRRRVQEGDRGRALALGAEGRAEGRQGPAAAPARDPLGGDLEGPQEHLRVAAELGDPGEVLGEADVPLDLVEGGAQEVGGEVEIAASAGLQEGEVAEDAGDRRRVVEDLELLLQVADQGEDVALVEGDGLDRAEDREVAGGRLERRLIALEGGVAVAEVGLDQLAALAVEGRRLPRVASRPNLLIQVTYCAANVAPPEVDPVEQTHRRPEIRDQLQRVGQEP